MYNNLKIVFNRPRQQQLTRTRAITDGFNNIHVKSLKTVSSYIIKIFTF